MHVDNIKVYNFDGAFRGMRNPKNSWHLSDSFFGFRNVDNVEQDLTTCAESWAKYDGYDFDDENYFDYQNKREKWLISNGIINANPNEGVVDIAFIGPKDMRLAKQLIAAGPEHRKFLRQITVSMDIDAPLYWWKEFDTYKVATVADSTSTMHKLTSKPITLESFEIGDYCPDLIIDSGVDDSGDNKFNYEYPLKDFIEDTGIKFYYEETLIGFLEQLRQKYLETSDIRYWKELVRWLPNGWLQKRTWTGNYETLRSMYHQRKNHKLTEWHTFCHMIEDLPYSEDLLLS